MNRRGFVSALLAAPLLVWTGDLFAEAAQFPGDPPQPGSQFPGSYPPRVQPMPPAPKIDPHAVLVQNQKNIKKDVNRLYKLAGKLRKQVNKTDSSRVLSLDMLETAEKIEKLAKHIRDLARG
jgi:hypothetical protein